LDSLALDSIGVTSNPSSQSSLLPIDYSNTSSTSNADILIAASPPQFVVNSCSSNAQSNAPYTVLSAAYDGNITHASSSANCSLHASSHDNIIGGGGGLCVDDFGIPCEPDVDNVDIVHHKLYVEDQSTLACSSSQEEVSFLCDADDDYDSSGPAVESKRLRSKMTGLLEDIGENILSTNFTGMRHKSSGTKGRDFSLSPHLHRRNVMNYASKIASNKIKDGRFGRKLKHLEMFSHSKHDSNTNKSPKHSSNIEMAVNKSESLDKASSESLQSLSKEKTSNLDNKNGHSGSLPNLENPAIFTTSSDIEPDGLSRPEEISYQHKKCPRLLLTQSEDGKFPYSCMHFLLQSVSILCPVNPL